MCASLSPLPNPGVYRPRGPVVGGARFVRDSGPFGRAGSASHQRPASRCVRGGRVQPSGAGARTRPQKTLVRRASRGRVKRRVVLGSLGGWVASASTGCLSGTGVRTPEPAARRDVSGLTVAVSDVEPISSASGGPPAESVTGTFDCNAVTATVDGVLRTSSCRTVALGPASRDTEADRARLSIFPRWDVSSPPATSTVVRRTTTLFGSKRRNRSRANSWSYTWPPTETARDGSSWFRPVGDYVAIALAACDLSLTTG